MMISPDYFRETELDGKTKEEIMTVIRRLKRWIAKTKEKAENPGNTVMICPDPETMISYFREYLVEAFYALKEAGGEYVETKEDKRAIAFQFDIEHITNITLAFHSHISPDIDCYSVDICKDKILINHNGITSVSDDFGYSREDWIIGLYVLNIGEWKKHYINKEAEGGETWELVFSYDNRKDRIYGGENAYPYNFHNLTEMLGRY